MIGWWNWTRINSSWLQTELHWPIDFNSTDVVELTPNWMKWRRLDWIELQLNRSDGTDWTTLKCNWIRHFNWTNWSKFNLKELVSWQQRRRRRRRRHFSIQGLSFSWWEQSDVARLPNHLIQFEFHVGEFVDIWTTEIFNLQLNWLK